MRTRGVQRTASARLADERRVVFIPPQNAPSYNGNTVSVETAAVFVNKLQDAMTSMGMLDDWEERDLLNLPPNTQVLQPPSTDFVNLVYKTVLEDLGEEWESTRSRLVSRFWLLSVTDWRSGWTLKRTGELAFDNLPVRNRYNAVFQRPPGCANNATEAVPVFIGDLWQLMQNYPLMVAVENEFKTKNTIKVTELVNAEQERYNALKAEFAQRRKNGVAYFLSGLNAYVDPQFSDGVYDDRADSGIGHYTFSSQNKLIFSDPEKITRFFQRATLLCDNFDEEFLYEFFECNADGVVVANDLVADQSNLFRLLFKEPIPTWFGRIVDNLKEKVETMFKTRCKTAAAQVRAVIQAWTKSPSNAPFRILSRLLKSTLKTSNALKTGKGFKA